MSDQAEEAAKAVALGKQALDADQPARAIKLFEKALRMRKTAEAEALLTAARSGLARQTQSSSPKPVPEQRPFTPEQAQGVKTILTAKSHYEALKIDRNASEDEIKRAYKKMALRYHPDKNAAPGAEDAFKKLSKAHSVLTDADKRAYYDRTGTDDDAGPVMQGGMPFGRGGGRPEDDLLRQVFQEFFHGGGGGFGGGGMFGPGIRVHQFGGGGGGFRQPRARREYARHGHDGGAAAGDDMNDVTWFLPYLQKLFQLFMFYQFFSWLSGGLGVTSPSHLPSHSRMSFSLSPTDVHPIMRQTRDSNRVVPQIPYYVSRDFEKGPGRNPSSLYTVEQQVELQHYNTLREKCTWERDAKRKGGSMTVSVACDNLADFERKKSQYSVR